MISDKVDKAVKQKAEHAISEQSFSQPKQHTFRRRKALRENQPLILVEHPNACWRTISKMMPMKRIWMPNAGAYSRKREI
jgi:hypothetical protein